MTKVQNLNSILLTMTAFAVVTMMTSCGSKDGFAPSLEKVPANTTSSTVVYLKNGSNVQASNGWKLDTDTTDAIKNLSTSNGWKVEVKYE